MARPYEVVVVIQDRSNGELRQRKWMVQEGVTIDNARLQVVAAWAITAIDELDVVGGVDDL